MGSDSAYNNKKLSYRLENRASIGEHWHFSWDSIQPITGFKLFF